MLSMYPACFYKEDEGYSVIFPDLNYLANIDPVAVSKEVSPDEPVGEAFVNMVSVDVEAYAKTLTIPAWLNAAALEQGINFSQTLQEALLAKVQALFIFLFQSTLIYVKLYLSK